MLSAKQLVVVCGTVVVLAVVIAYGSIVRIQTIKEEDRRTVIALQEEATAREKLIQEEKTHRTEERSQAWRLPWTKDTDNTFNREEK